jgi:hypothetical protein
MKLTQFFLNLFKPINEEIIMEQPQVKPVTKKIQVTERPNTKFANVKRHLFEKGTIDSWTAIHLYGATRLSAIIFKLRQRGYNIESIANSSFDRNNEVCNFTTYKYIQ